MYQIYVLFLYICKETKQQAKKKKGRWSVNIFYSFYMLFFIFKIFILKVYLILNLHTISFLHKKKNEEKYIKN